MELLVVVTILGILSTFVATASIQLAQSAAKREAVEEVQSSSRRGVAALAREIRRVGAGFGGGSSTQTTENSPVAGTISATIGGVPSRRPAIQIYDNIGPGGWLPVKPGTDALLIAGATADRSATRGPLTGPTAPPPLVNGSTSASVASTASFWPGAILVLGDYSFGAGWWTRVTGVNPPNDLIVDPVPGAPDQGIAPGSVAAIGFAYLYFVDGTNDDLIQLSLAVPRPPAGAAEGLSRYIVSQGFENLQIEAWVERADGSGAIDTRPPGPAIAAGDPIFDDMAAAFGGGTPLITLREAPMVRAVTVNAEVRSIRSVRGTLAGEPPINLVTNAGTSFTQQSLALVAAGSDPQYLRRAYRATVATRNLSLESE